MPDEVQGLDREARESCHFRIVSPEESTRGPLRPLREHLASRGSLGVREAIKLARDVAEALTVLHLRGLTAGAVDGEHVVVAPCGTEAFLLLEDRGRRPHGIEEGLTGTVREDLRALGLLLFRLIAGRQLDTASDLLHLRRGFQLALIYNPRVPQEVDDLLSGLLLGRDGSPWAWAKDVLGVLRRALCAMDRPAAGMPAEPAVPVCEEPPARRSAPPEEVERVQRMVEDWALAKARERTCAASTATRAARQTPVAGWRSWAGGFHGSVRRVLAGLAVVLLAALLTLKGTAPLSPQAGADAGTVRARARAAGVSSAAAGASRAELKRLRLKIMQAGRSPTTSQSVSERLALLEEVVSLGDGSLAPGTCDALRRELAARPQVVYGQVDGWLTATHVRDALAVGGGPRTHR